MRVSYWADKGWRIEWSFKNIPVSSEIFVNRAEGPEGPWVAIPPSPLPSSAVYFEDCLKEYRGFFKPVWYQVIAMDGGEIVAQTEPMSSSDSSDLITSEIIRQHELTLKGVNGHPGYYAGYFACFKRTRFTERYEDSRGFNGERMLADSSPDQNTGSAPGYANPCLFRGRWLNTVQKQVVMQPSGMRETFTRQLWTTNFPEFYPGDIICEKGTGRIYEITSIDCRKPNNILISQTALCTQIDPQMWEAQNLRYP